ATAGPRIHAGGRRRFAGSPRLDLARGAVRDHGARDRLGRLRILTVNAGSSSVKLSLIGDHDEALERCELPAPEAPLDPGRRERALGGGLSDADAVAHRVVHGGERFREATVIDQSVVHELRELTELAPLHQPKSLAALDAVAAPLPQVPAVACFD